MLNDNQAVLTMNMEDNEIKDVLSGVFSISAKFSNSEHGARYEVNINNSNGATCEILPGTLDDKRDYIIKKGDGVLEMSASFNAKETRWYIEYLKFTPGRIASWVNGYDNNYEFYSVDCGSNTGKNDDMLLTLNVKDKRILEALNTFGIDTPYLHGRCLIDTVDNDTLKFVIKNTSSNDEHKKYIVKSTGFRTCLLHIHASFDAIKKYWYVEYIRVEHDWLLPSAMDKYRTVVSFDASQEERGKMFLDKAKCVVCEDIEGVVITENFYIFDDGPFNSVSFYQVEDKMVYEQLSQVGTEMYYYGIGVTSGDATNDSYELWKLSDAHGLMGITTNSN